MPDIQAQSADGTTHSFPDGTKPEVIDGVMKSYAQSKTPQAAPADAMTQIDKPPVAGIGATSKALVEGGYHFIKDILDPSVPVYQGPESLWNRYVSDPFRAQQAQAKALWATGDPLAKVSAAGHEMASFIPFAGPMAAQAGEQLGQAWKPGQGVLETASNVGGGLISGATALSMGRGLANPARALRAPSDVAAGAEGAAKTLGTARGKAQLLLGGVNSLDKSWESAMTDVDVAKANVGTRIGQLVKTIADEDVKESASKGRVGSVKTGKFNDALVAGLDKFGVLDASKTPLIDAASKMIEETPAKVTWEHAKNLRTAVGKLAYSAGKDAKQRAVLTGIYEDMSKSLETRATELNQGEAYGAYNKLHQTMSDYAHDGIYKQLKNADTGTAGFDLIHKTATMAKLADFNKDMSEFGLADNFFKDLKDSHAATYRLIKANEGMVQGFRGKFQALGQHKLAAGSAFVGINALPLPGRFIFSLFGAAKAADIADRIQAASEMNRQGGAPEITGKFGKASKVKPSEAGVKLQAGEKPEGEEE